MSWIIGVDVGGTFTDFFAFREEDGAARKWKRPSTPSNPAEAIIVGLKELCETHAIDLRDVTRLCHGSTVATNTLIQRRGADCAMITTKGLRDVIEIGRQTRPHTGNFNIDAPPPLIPRKHRYELGERVRSTGEVYSAVPLDELDALIETIRAEGLQAVAVCFLFSYVNPTHEAQVGAALRAALPGVSVSLSSEVQPEFREFERFTTTVVNAYLQPRLEHYIETLINDLAATIPDAQVGINQSSGGANLGPMIASSIAMTLAFTWGDDFIADGGWRVPFLLSVPLGTLAFYLRRQMSDDGLLHSNAPIDEKRARFPLSVALRGHWRTVAIVVALCAGQRVGGICIQAYFVTALIRLGYSSGIAMLVSIVLFALGIPACWVGGRLADRFGGRPILIGGFALYTVLAVPLFMAMGVSVPLTIAGLILCTINNNVMAAPLNLASIMSFPREIRGAASALNFNIGIALIGSTAPLIATWLVTRTGSETAFGWYWAVICFVSFLTAVFAYPRQLTR